jgi:hypothetical protein
MDQENKTLKLLKSELKVEMSLLILKNKKDCISVLWEIYANKLYNLNEMDNS